MADTPGTIAYREAGGDVVPIAVLIDDDDARIPQHQPRVNGAVVSTANPMPAADAGVGPVAATAWSGTGSGSLVAIMKGIWGFLAAALTIRPSGATFTQTVVAVDEDGVLLLPTTTRKYVTIVNIDVKLVTIGVGVLPAAGYGVPLAAAPSVGDQGGAITFEASVITSQEFYARCLAGETGRVVVLEGV